MVIHAAVSPRCSSLPGTTLRTTAVPSWVMTGTYTRAEPSARREVNASPLRARSSSSSSAAPSDGPIRVPSGSATLVWSRERSPTPADEVGELRHVVDRGDEGRHALGLLARAGERAVLRQRPDEQAEGDEECQDHR